MKTCRDCKQELSLDNFSKDNSTDDRLRIYCKHCISKRNRKSYKPRPEYIREYYLTNKIAIQERIEKWQASHPGYARRRYLERKGQA